MWQRTKRGSGRASGSSIVNGRGHVRNHHKSGSGHGRGQGIQLPNQSSRSKMLSFGLSLVGFGPERQQCKDDLCMRRFYAHFGLGPKPMKALIADLKEDQPNKPLDKISLFMAITWLRLYETEELMAGWWGFGEKYCREIVRDYVSRIQALKPKKIKFDDLPPKCEFLPVDVVHIRCQEFRCKPNSKWWSHKSNGAAVALKL